MPPITIVGAGIAGLALSLALSRLGRRSVIIETAERLDPVGAGVQVPPNAFRVLQALELERELNSIASAPREIVIRDCRADEPLVRVPVGAEAERRFGAPSLVVHRGDLQAILLDAVHRSGRVDLRLGTPFEASGGAEGWLIGADGVNSTVRSIVRPHDPQASRTGTVAWRAMLPTRDLTSSHWRSTTGLVLAPGKHLVHYPVSSGTMLNLVLLAHDTGNAVVSNETLAPFNRYIGELELAREAWSSWPIATVDENGGWFCGRTVLIGDAAHAMTPHAAQGGAMALEDAITLAATLAAEEPRLEDWEKARRRRVARVAALSRRNKRIYWASDPVRLARNMAMRSLPPALLTRGMDALYSWEPPAIRSRP